jgi:hypothetical protein
MYYIPRREMPQVDEKDLPELVVASWQSGHHPSFEVVNPLDLHAHQRVNRTRALGMPENVKRKPVLVSLDNYVLDGNHRWYAHRMEETPMNVIRIGLSFEDALPWLFKQPFTYKLTPETPERN